MGSLVPASAANMLADFRDNVRIRRYYPHCAVAAAEVACRNLTGSPRFDLVYGYHTFELTAGAGKPRLKEGSGECDFSFSREASIGSELWDELAGWYGLIRGHRPISDLEELIDGVSGSLDAGTPLVVDFDMGFLKGRKEYERIFSKHVVCIIGVDRARRCFTALEQIHGLLEIDFAEFEKCILRHREVHGAYNLLTFSRRDTQSGMDPRARALNRIDANLANIGSASESLGFNALRRFHGILGWLLEISNADCRPFFIPGMWAFSHERYALPFYVEEVCRLFGVTLRSPPRKSIDALHKAWLMVDGALEANYASFDSANNSRIAKYFPVIMEYEFRIGDMWQELRERLAPTR